LLFTANQNSSIRILAKVGSMPLMFAFCGSSLGWLVFHFRVLAIQKKELR